MDRGFEFLWNHNVFRHFLYFAFPSQHVRVFSTSWTIADGKVYRYVKGAGYMIMALLIYTTYWLHQRGGEGEYNMLLGFQYLVKSSIC